MNTALRLFLVDDELPALNRLQDILSDCAQECPNQVIGTATNGRQGMVRQANLQSPIRISGGVGQAPVGLDRIAQV